MCNRKIQVLDSKIPEFGSDLVLPFASFRWEFLLDSKSTNSWLQNIVILLSVFKKQKSTTDRARALMARYGARIR
jgi:hypothetical protein